MILKSLGLVFYLAGSALALYDGGSDVVTLTESNFDKLVVNSDDVWIVEFFAPWCGHCVSFAPAYEKAAKALKGVVKVGAVDATVHDSLSSRYGVKGFPTVKLFINDKKSPTSYNGERTAAALTKAAIDEITKKVNRATGSSSSSGGSRSDSKSGSGSTDDVVELTDSNFDKLVLDSSEPWLVEFYAPWCGHCKNLAPHWAKAASELKGKVKLGALDATVHQSKASEYGIRGYPTLKYFAPGSRDSSAAEDYEGGRTSSDIVAFGLSKFSESAPPPELFELISEDVATKACDGKQLCVVSILPHILDCDAKCRNKYLDILKTNGEKFKGKPWGWLWTEAGAQPNVEEALELGGFGYPAMSAVNYKKMKKSTLLGSFSANGISEFLRDISYGRGNTSPVKGADIPKILNVEPWDGKDGQLPEEEDIDLSDVDLDDKDEL